MWLKLTAYEYGAETQNNEPIWVNFNSAYSMQRNDHFKCTFIQFMHYSVDVVETPEQIIKLNSY
jgi:hypothetical protein